MPYLRDADSSVLSNLHASFSPSCMGVDCNREWVFLDPVSLRELLCVVLQYIGA